jgi:hypothetical protein
MDVCIQKKIVKINKVNVRYTPLQDKHARKNSQTRVQTHRLYLLILSKICIKIKPFID